MHARVLQVLSIAISAVGVLWFMYGGWSMLSLPPSDHNACTMTYMMPNYINIDVNMTEHSFSSRYITSKYSLFHYIEGGDGAARHHFSGHPVLFIPGNAGNGNQIRSIAAEIARLYSSYNIGTYVDGDESSSTQANKTWYGLPYGINPHDEIDVFAIDFSEELTAFSGRLIWEQTAYARDAMSTILSLYTEPRDIILIGHSMGGVIARAVPLLRQEGRDNTVHIHNIITITSPYTPVVMPDVYMSRYYYAINNAWGDAWSDIPHDDSILHGPHGLEMYSHMPKTLSYDMILVNVASGYRDDNVSPAYSLANYHARHYIGANMNSIIGIDTDHRASMWCNQLAIRLAVTVHAMHYNDDRYSLISKVLLSNDWMKPLDDGGVTRDDGIGGESRRVIVDVTNSHLSKWNKTGILLDESRDSMDIDAGQLLSPWSSVAMTTFSTVRMEFSRMSLIYAIRLCVRSSTHPLIFSVAGIGGDDHRYVHVDTTTVHFEDDGGGGFIDHRGDYCTILRSVSNVERRRDVLIVSDSADQMLTVTASMDWMVMSEQYARYYGVTTLLVMAHIVAVCCIFTYCNSDKCVVKSMHGQSSTSCVYAVIDDVPCHVMLGVSMALGVLYSVMLSSGVVFVQFLIGGCLAVVVTVCVKYVIVLIFRAMVRYKISLNSRMFQIALLVTSFDPALNSVVVVVWMVTSCAHGMVRRVDVKFREIMIPRLSIVVISCMNTTMMGATLMASFRSLLNPVDLIAMLHSALSDQWYITVICAFSSCIMWRHKPFSVLSVSVSQGDITCTEIRSGAYAWHYIAMASVTWMIWIMSPYQAISLSWYGCVTTLLLIGVSGNQNSPAKNAELML